MSCCCVNLIPNRPTPAIATVFDIETGALQWQVPSGGTGTGAFPVAFPDLGSLSIFGRLTSPTTDQFSYYKSDGEQTLAPATITSTAGSGGVATNAGMCVAGGTGLYTDSNLTGAKYYLINATKSETPLFTELGTSMGATRVDGELWVAHSSGGTGFALRKVSSDGTVATKHMSDIRINVAGGSFGWQAGFYQSCHHDGERFYVTGVKSKLTPVKGGVFCFPGATGSGTLTMDDAIWFSEIPAWGTGDGLGSRWLMPVGSDLIAFGSADRTTNSLTHLARVGTDGTLRWSVQVELLGRALGLSGASKAIAVRTLTDLKIYGLDGSHLWSLGRAVNAAFAPREDRLAVVYSVSGTTWLEVYKIETGEIVWKRPFTPFPSGTVNPTTYAWNDDILAVGHTPAIVSIDSNYDSWYHS